MRHALLATLGLAALAASAAGYEKTFAVNEYFGVPYEKEPVSFDVEFDAPVPVGHIHLDRPPWQVEILDGTPEAVAKARVWTLVDFPHRKVTRVEGKGEKAREVEVTAPLPGAERHRRFTVRTSPSPKAAGAMPCPLQIEPAEPVGGIATAVISNGRFRARVPVGGAVFDPPVPAFDVPGPVVSVSRDGKEWIGSGYLDTVRRVRRVTCETVRGTVYFESHLRYEFNGGRVYDVRVRMFPAKPYALLVGDFDLGGRARYVFNYDDWFADAFFRTGDNRLYGWEPITAPDPCNDFVRMPGQEALARLVIWTQFNYFGGKQETVALKAPDPKALEEAYRAAVERYREDVKRYQEQLAKWKQDPKKNKEPREPRQPEKPVYEETVHTLGGAPIRAASVATPGGDSTAVGAFYVRPDRWTHAKVNHVDLYMRPEVPGDRMTRGIVGLEGAKARIAMEAWLVDGHREWAIFAVASGDQTWLAKAHVQEGAWPLDRINRLPLVWNSDGTPVKPEHTGPSGDGTAGGAAGAVLLGTRGRSGLQHFNGSNGNIRGTCPPREGWDGKVAESRAEGGDTLSMAGKAMTAYLASDDSAYPSRRAVLPWTHPEALNPFYQGMENMNFNADLYRYVSKHGLDLARMGHPEAERFIRHAEESFDMALDRYVYPESGCWEESHGYAGHTIHTVGPMCEALANSGRKNFLEDIRFARMLEFFLYVHSPVDPEFGNRVVPPVGDHGLSRSGPASRFRDTITVFTGSKNPDVQRIVRRAAWMIREDGGQVPNGVEPERPDLSSRWLRGYGTVMRALGRSAPALALTLEGAIAAEDKKGQPDSRDLLLNLAQQPGGGWSGPLTGSSPGHNTARHDGEARASGSVAALKIAARVNVNADKWVKGGKGEYAITLAKRSEDYAGAYSGTYEGQAVSGKVVARLDHPADESFVVLRAGQSWGHHHEDKGSMWFWGRNVHFFGDCSWGGPPGGTYGNKYKQGPASGTQIEFVGVNNWPLPCKYPGPWISDDEYADAFDYANARCVYPYNPKLDLSKSSPVALRNAYDRQVLFVHPDLLVVRDNVETVCPTIWRMHSFQPEGTKVSGHRATLASAQGPTGELAVLHPRDGVNLRVVDRDILNKKYFDEDGNPKPFEELPKFNGSVELRWDMPEATSATWVFAVRGADEKAPAAEVLDPDGRVTRVRLADGTEVTALLSIEPFAWSGEGIDFEGTVGLVIRKGGKATAHAVRAERLEVR